MTRHVWRYVVAVTFFAFAPVGQGVLAQVTRSAPASETTAMAGRDGAPSRLRTALSEISDVRETSRGLILNLPDVRFDLDRATLTREGRETLALFEGVLQNVKDYHLTIEGHTDSLGPPEYNYELGLERAMSVRDYLVAGGVDSNLVTVESFGETKPITNNETGASRQENRRVEIVVIEGPSVVRFTSQ